MAVLTLSAASAAKLTEIRRDLHRYPELCWLEYRTTALIAQKLYEAGAEVVTGRPLHAPEAMLALPPVETRQSCLRRAEEEYSIPAALSAEMLEGFTGAMGIVRGALPGPTVMLRFDIDCNEVQESADPDRLPVKEDFCSRHPGWMHACGHDGHTAIGIGVAQLLTQHRSQLCGEVRLLFQPAEEGGRGALSHVAAGLFDDVDYLLAAHIGLAADRFGTVSAATHGFLCSSKLDFRFTGLSAHAGKNPELGHNALAAAVTAVSNMLAIPRHSAGGSRINIGVLQAGPGRNVIPDYAQLQAETRGASEEINAYMAAHAKRIARCAAEMHRCGCEEQFVGCSTESRCSDPLVDLVLQTLADIPEVDKPVRSLDIGAGEDYAQMMNRVLARGGQTTLMMLGSELPAPHHSKNFDFDERVLPLGVKLFTALVLTLCGGKNPR